MNAAQILSSLGISPENSGAIGKTVSRASSTAKLDSFSPIDGKLIARVNVASDTEYEQVMRDLEETFLEWRKVPAPERGQLVREVAQALRDNKKALGALVTLEMGKILTEGEGEIQEAIDIADYAVGLSRQLYGNTMHSERRLHRMYEQWHPLGIVGVITAFNFPAAVWAWNAMIAAVCGDVILWKPSEYTPLTALATNEICRKVAEKRGFPGLFSLVVGNGPDLGKRMAEDRRIPLISATGSCRMGRSVGETVSRRLGRTILELGGNNAIIVMADADFDLAMRAIVFGAVGTAGQRCTSTRRVFIEKSAAPEFTKRLVAAYKQVKIGDPFESGTLMGPLINKQAVESYKAALKAVKDEGGEILCGGEVVSGMPSELYVQPTIVQAHARMHIIREETFAPILYVIPVSNIEEAIECNNAVPQGLSSSIFTKNMQNAERFLSHAGSDCGIANVNIGTSGAEIGGAFGGEKDTGGGREAGSDSWKAYMRRQTTTINYGNELPLAQGIEFNIK